MKEYSLHFTERKIFQRLMEWKNVLSFHFPSALQRVLISPSTSPSSFLIIAFKRLQRMTTTAKSFHVEWNLWANIWDSIWKFIEFASAFSISSHSETLHHIHMYKLHIRPPISAQWVLPFSSQKFLPFEFESTVFSSRLVSLHVWFLLKIHSIRLLFDPPLRFLHIGQRAFDE